VEQILRLGPLRTLTGKTRNIPRERCYELESNLHERENKLNYGEDKDVSNPSKATTTALRTKGLFSESALE